MDIQISALVACMILQTINMYIAVGIYFPLILSKYRQQNRIISLSVSLLIYLPIFIYLSTYKSSSILLSATRLKNTYIYWNGWIYDGKPPSSDYHWRERQTEPVLWLVVSTWPRLPIGPWRGEYGAAPEAGRCALETARSPGREGVRACGQRRMPTERRCWKIV